MLNVVLLRGSSHLLLSRVWWSSTETDKVLQKMQDCMTSLFNLIDGENQRLSEEVSLLTR